MDMIMDSKRQKQLQLVNIFRYAMIGGIVLVFLSWLLPFITSPEGDWGLSKGYKDTKSVWGIMLYPANFLQIEKLLSAEVGEKVKYISLKHLHTIVICAITGIIGIIACANKRGIGTTILPLFFSIYGVYGYTCNFFMKLGVKYGHALSYYIQLVFFILTLLVSLASFVLCIMEMKSRPADYYLTGPGE